MDILLCNDDGIHAPGIRRLREAVTDLGRVRVVAPSDEQSAVGHAITIFDPIKMHPITGPNGESDFAVSGTPSDCVKLAVCELFKDEPPDVLISGINLGPNTGISVIYSGTVSAATEAMILGIPGMALSLASFTDPQWDTAQAVARHLAKLLLKHRLPPDILLNVNIPNVPLADLKGYAVTTMARSRYNEEFHKRTDPRNNTYFWLDGELEILQDGAGTDVQAVKDGYVSVTPIQIDLTAHGFLDELRTWDLPNSISGP